MILDKEIYQQNKIIILGILIEVLVDLEHMHENSQVHNDIKMLNILINENGLVKLGDLCLCSQVRLKLSETSGREVPGNRANYFPKLVNFLSSC